MGELAQPVIAPAKEKVKKMVVYIWLQPYAGYAWGTSDQMRVTAGGGLTKADGLDTSGFVYGGRGGLLIYNTFRVGLDYSVQSIKRDTLGETASKTYIRQSGDGRNTLLGATIGFDLPYTPLQGQLTKYFSAKLSNDEANSGEGWGGGVSFVLKNPFILSIEKRKLNYATRDITGKRADGTIDQFYVTLSFMLL